MREAARALDDVSDHLGEVLRHADELLAEWGRFGAQVRSQVEREAGAIGAVVDGAVERAASSGIDRAIADRLRLLSAEIERVEQRARAASRAVSEQRDADRRVLWIVVAGVVLANALLVVLLLRKPEPVRVPEPIRVEAVGAPLAGQPSPAAGATDGSAAGTPNETAPGAGSPELNAGAGSGAIAGANSGASAGANGGPSAATSASSTGAMSGSGAGAGSNAMGAKLGSKAAALTASKPGTPSGAQAGDGGGSAKPAASPILLPQKPGAAHAHKKLP